MTIYLAMDDTDNLDSRGTGKLARAAASAIAKEYPVKGVTRHQLFVHEDIPFTSHNSCGVIHIEASGNDAKEWIFETAKEVMLDDFIDGSDPGIAVAGREDIKEPLISFGRDAQRVVLNQEKARTLAKNLGIRLEGLGGTEDGVIGTMAGLGLACTLNDGRYLMLGKIREMTGPAEVSTLLDAGIDVVYTMDGRRVNDGLIIIAEGKSAKPCPVDGRAVLFVEEIDGEYHAVKRG
ncbi:ABC transporter substrate-binding protein [Methanoplanus sp. FWC-SCC4]|uniref:ABC transporter substrate-binding protein n=1 Tax=Methanochimaera problematica TaxID=2609417 RepID=A0AA97I358_9EURY|nr:ABC transporter substrate-binding protein [Methanoplanus sp. FWC-SCC4]WOF15314.1 ABC transporter substrate-binding protein [Methanoplanus sp. FWC-SCC4]